MTSIPDLDAAKLADIIVAGVAALDPADRATLDAKVAGFTVANVPLRRVIKVPRLDA